VTRNLRAGVCVGLALFRGDRLLLLRRVPDPADRWGLPGGSVRSGEPLERAVARTTVRLSGEHKAAAWAERRDVRRYRLVPGLGPALDAAFRRQADSGAATGRGRATGRPAIGSAVPASWAVSAAETAGRPGVGASTRRGRVSFQPRRRRTQWRTSAT
jgi:hypothetical protein